MSKGMGRRRLYSNAAIRYSVLVTTTIQINRRGAMTLPKSLRKVLGVDQGGVIIAEVSETGIALHPAVAYPVELYSDARVAEFDAAETELGKRLARGSR